MVALLLVNLCNIFIGKCLLLSYNDVGKEIRKMSEGIEVLLPIIMTLASTISAYSAKREYDKADEKKEDAKVKEAVEGISISSEDNDNVIKLMLKNVKELREYYVISKHQARKSFSAALFICFFGISIYLFGILSFVFLEKNISIISIIGGTVVEVIAGLFFWLYKEATRQLSIYHQRLGSTEKYLTVIQIIKEMPEDKRTEAFQNLIEAILKDNRAIISNENKNTL